LHPDYIRSDPEFSAVIERMTAHEEIAIDCEFHTEGRYFPRLCLVQLAFGSECLAVDPRTVRLAPLSAVLESASVRKLMHDGRQDLPILTRATGATQIRNVFDTQVAAAFAGFGGKIGYAGLLRELFDVKIDKSLQVSDWTNDLSDAQLKYALDDVRYLAQTAAELRDRLAQCGRDAWAREACDEAVANALRRPDPEKLYRRVSSTSQLEPRALGILRELAKWRDRVAQAQDKPVTAVAGDLALKSMALRPPRSRRDIEAVRGLGSGRNHPWVDELLEAVRQGEARPEPNPRFELSKQREAQLDGLVGVLGLARRFVAVREGIAAELLVDQAELRALAEWQLDGRPESTLFEVLGGWRKLVIGETLLSVLSGSFAFRADATAASGLAALAL
jgi:ribonuclease D